MPPARWPGCSAIWRKAAFVVGKKTVTLRYGEAVKQLSLDFAAEMATHRASSLYLRVELVIGKAVVSRQTVFLTAPRYLALKESAIRAGVKKVAPRHYELTFVSPTFQPWVAFELPGIAHRADDNFIDLYPREAFAVSSLRTEKDLGVPVLRGKLSVTSLADSYGAGTRPLRGGQSKRS